MNQKSPISFEQFMARALHAPNRGYYARHISSIGSRGDFTTAPQLSEAPAKAIASWASDAMRDAGTNHLIEIGPGQGVLAAAVRKHLPWRLRRRLKLHLVETSSPLTAQQKDRLGGNAIWHTHPSSALYAARGNAVIFSNELVDAFPVRRFAKTQEGWREIGVILDPIQEQFLPETDLPASSGFGPNHGIGQRIEVHQSYRHWLGEWMPSWKRGRLLTIDYGSTAETLYHRRPRGTIRGYLLQQRIEGLAIYQNMGRQDLTADVNFTDLIDWTQTWCEEETLCSLGEFLQARGQQEKALLDPAGAGSAFLVLDQRCRSGKD